MEPGYADGWVNVARVRLQEGDTGRGRERSCARRSRSSRGSPRPTSSSAQRSRRRAATTRRSSTRAAAQALYPRDRVVVNQAGRLLFLKRQHAEAIAELKKVLSIDPEDLQAHYNLMLAYQGAGNTEMAKKHQTLYERFKADEAAQFITGPYRQLHPHDNNERQSIHEHRTAEPAPQPSPSRPAGYRAVGVPRPRLPRQTRPHPTRKGRQLRSRGSRTAAARGAGSEAPRRPRRARRGGASGERDAPGAVGGLPGRRLHGRDGRLGRRVPPPERRLRQEVPARDDGLRRRVPRLRRRRRRRTSSSSNSTRWPGRPEKPGLPALYRNDGKGTLQRRDAAAGLAVEMYGLGAAAADYDNDGKRRPLRDVPGREPPVPQPGRRQVQRRDGDGRRGRCRLRHERHVLRLRQGRPARPGGRQLRRRGRSRRTCSARSTARASPIARPSPTRARASTLYRGTRRRHLRGRHEEGRARGRARQVARA